MLKQEVIDTLNREPFVPVRIYLNDDRTFVVPHRDAFWILGYGVLIFKGMKEGTRQAKSYDRFPFDYITHIEDRPMKRRKKAS